MGRSQGRGQGSFDELRAGRGMELAARDDGPEEMVMAEERS